MKNGFREKAQLSKRELTNQLGTQLRNVQMATRVLQMGLEQLGNSYKGINSDMDRVMGLLAHMQYKQEALLALSGLSEEAVNAKADELRLNEYNNKSQAEDVQLGYTPVDTVKANSIVTITSSCATDKVKEIFRSKFDLSTCGHAEMQEKLLGKAVGDKVDVTINNDVHVVELLAIRSAPDVVPTPPAATDAALATAEVPENNTPAAH